MKRAGLALMGLVATTWLIAGVAHADWKLATLSVKGMVCQA